ncbi:transcription repressor OFP2 [Panicum miliaceum]|uniref:Transcription repressor n=1 Tax=Panicum miliaceum TaxID=4540 RepID=A0A3L6SU67_PANMI|nr:transcription repressor OFP2 [Panicum miliaceum]
MGRHKFRLSDMIPNAWFFKLRDMRARGGGAAAASPRVAAAHAASRPLPSTPRHGGGAAWLPHRASHYYTPRAGDIVLGSSPLHPRASDTRFPPLQLSPPRRSSRRRHHRRRSVKLAAPSSVSSSSGVASSPASAAGCRCGRRPELVAVEAPDTPPCRRDMFVGYSSDDDDDDDGEDLKKPTLAARADDKLDGKVFTSATEIIIDLRTKRRPERTLPPITTKPARKEPDGCELEDKHIDVLKHATQRTPPAPEQSKLKPRRSVSSARRLKTRANTPRIASPRKCKPPATTPRSPALARATPPPLAESFAVVKSSRDPKRDFRESMEEMIAENGIRTAADLEDLLACYLALNAAEYHDLIVEVFEHIWVTLTDVKM